MKENMLNFKLNILSGIILFAIIGLCLWHIPILFNGWGIAFIFIFAIYFYQLGRLVEIERRDKILPDYKLQIETKLLEELISSKMFELFPDIQNVVIKWAIKKFTDLGDKKHADELKEKLYELY